MSDEDRNSRSWLSLTDYFTLVVIAMLFFVMLIVGLAEINTTLQEIRDRLPVVKEKP